MYRLLLVSLILFIGCQQEVPPSASALSEEEIALIEREVTESFEAVVESAKNGDAEKELTLHAERKDGFFLNGTNLMTMSEVEEAVRSSAENDTTNTVLRQEINGLQKRVVVLNPTVALVASQFPDGRAIFDDGTVNEFRGASTFIFIKENEEWKVHSIQQALYPLEEGDTGEM